MRTRRLFLVFMLLSLLAGSTKAEPGITVAVAANVQYAMHELKAEFVKETGIKLSVVIGSSGQLTAQIKEGAPYDVFISADMKYPNTLYKEGFAVDTPRIYASGTLVIWTMDKGIQFGKGLKILLDKKIKKIALANPRTAPYGVAAVNALKNLGVYEQVKYKLVYGESISPTNQFIVSKAVEAGFTAKSVVVSPRMKGKGTWKEIEPGLYDPIRQGCVILKHGYKNHKDASEKFYNFLFSNKAKVILSKFGYIAGEKSE